MDHKTHTTATLRQTLFATIEGVIDGTVTEKKAAQVANLANQIVKTADLEMRYTEHAARLDFPKNNPDAKAPGPMTLSVEDRRGDR